MRIWWFLMVACLAACSSVVVPVERSYRLELPEVQAPDAQRAGVLRVDCLQLGTAIDCDRLLQQQGLRLQARPLARWVAPLDRLVTDALVLGLSRARVCELVKSAVDPGGETWTLRGRIVDFAEGAGEAGREARVTLELWLEDGRGLVFHDEFAQRVPVVAPADAGETDVEMMVVRALSAGLRQVVTDVVGRLHSTGALAAARARSDAAAAAVPAR